MPENQRRIVLALALGSATAALISIAASQILMGLAIAAMLFFRVRWQAPPFWPALAAFTALTLLSVAFSGNPAAGAGQVKKFYVFTILFVIFSLRPVIAEIRVMVIAWAGVSAVSALIGVGQFAGKYQQARDRGLSFYEFYVGDRTTGFMSHWMTFSGEQMITLLMLLALLLFGGWKRGKMALWLIVGLLGISLLLGFTRSVWLGAAAGTLYLIWFWRRWMVALAPVALAIVLWINPGEVRARFLSAFQPRGDNVDSNRHREVTRRVGWEMIRAHPLLGLGPGVVGPAFEKYVPSDVQRPLPVGFYGHLHNVYIHYAAERGIPAVFALLWMLAWVLRDFARAKPDFVIRGAVAVLLSVILSGWYEVNLGDSEILTLVLAVIACGYSRVRCSGSPERLTA
ncbi:MAG: O-antigen ligase family protein [Bryobacteraceae bacterium]|nr:O-antigen ligase family protein [Bryobacteraceae bacterium]